MNSSNEIKSLKATVVESMENMKALDITSIDIKNTSSVTDIVIIATGTSLQHVKSVAYNIIKSCKEIGLQPLSVNGLNKTEWVLVDLGDIVVNVMTENSRDYYDLENIWMPPETHHHKNHIENSTKCID